MILGLVTDSVGPILPAGADGDCGEEFSPALRVHLCPVCREVSPTNCPQSDASKVHRHKGSKQHWRWGALGACTGGGERWVFALDVWREETSLLPCSPRMFLLYMSSLFVMIIALFIISKQCVSPHPHMIQCHN